MSHIRNMTSSVKRFDVSIAGEINLDLILYGLAEVIPVEREILATDFRCTLGGSSSIVAHNLASLGASVGFTTRLGKDEFGRIALERLAESGADLSEVVYAEDSTSTGVTILLHHGAKRRILTYPGTMSGMSRADLNFDYLASARHFHLSSLFLQKALAPDLPALFRDLKQAGLTISLDTNDDPDNLWDGVLHEVLPYVDLLLPNADEVCRIARRDTVEESLLALSSCVPCIAAKCGRGRRFVADRQQSHPYPTDSSDADRHHWRRRQLRCRLSLWVCAGRRSAGLCSGREHYRRAVDVAAGRHRSVSRCGLP